MTMGTFYYDNQIKRYVNQFCAIFQQMQVQVGKNGTRSEPGLIDVPIIIGPLDRVAASAATGHTQNRPIRLPMMSAHLAQYELARDRMKGTGVHMREVFVPIGGTLEQDGKVIYQRQAVPYDLTMELYVYTSNKDQQFQILEQIFVLFDPSLQIQTSDGPFDRAKIITVELTNIGNEENFPPGTEAGNIVVCITFKVDAYIEIPADIKQNLVKQIILRVSAVDDPHIGTIYSDGANNNQIGDIYDAENVEKIILEPKPID